jgi:predicted transcriptional regulator
MSVALITMVLSLSYLAIAYPCPSIKFAAIQDVDDAHRLIFSSSLVVGAALHDNSTLLNQTTRMKIYNLVRDNPGIHFRAICSSLNISIGVAQYHLDILTKAGFISVYTDGMYKRYFPSKTFTADDMKIISLLRHNTIRSILFLLSKNTQMTHKELASKIGITSQALTWQMNRLKKTGLINISQEGMSRKYSLNPEKATIMRRHVASLFQL